MLSVKKGYKSFIGLDLTWLGLIMAILDTLPTILMEHYQYYRFIIAICERLLFARRPARLRKTFKVLITSIIFLEIYRLLKKNIRYTRKIYLESGNSKLALFPTSFMAILLFLVVMDDF